MVASSDKSGSSGAENLESRQISLLGQAIRYFREDQRLTQEALADLAKIDKQRISDIERGETRSLHGPTVKKICDGLAISLDELRVKEREFGKVADAGRAQPTEPHSDSPPAALVHNDIRAVPGFTGREDLLEHIEQALWQTGTAALTNSGAHAAAVKGLGGIGKSVLAREYAWRARERYRGVWWARAETEQTLIDDLIDLGSRLIPNLKAVQERDRALHLALDAIAGAGGDKPWLIVYDNVEKPGAIRKLKPREHTHILITSRWPDWQDEARELPVNVFASEVAIDYLLAKRPHETSEAAGRLATALGHLPLALSHARAYCAETNLSFDAYAQRLSELIQEAPEDAEYSASVFATFSLAITKAAEICPEAEKLMEIAAFLAPDRIPLNIITDDVMSEKRREKAVRALFRVSLITHGTLPRGSRCFTIHRLLQKVMCGRLGRSVDAAYSLALKGILPLVPKGTAAGEHTAWPLMECLLPHCLSILNHASGNADPDIALLSSLVAVYFRRRAAYFVAEPLISRALEIRNNVLGPNHPATAASLHDLAELYRDQGRYHEAEPLCLRALNIREAIFGPEHTDTGASVLGLGLIYRARGMYAKAEPLYKRALNIGEKTLGPEHRSVATRLTNLANIYRDQSRYKEAEIHYVRALEIRQNILGSQHPDVAATLNNLAELHRVQGRYHEAEPLQTRALAIREETLGPDHPDIAQSLNNLASLYRDQGRYGEAEAMCERALRMGAKMLGPEHPHIAGSLNNLAEIYRAQGRNIDAEPLLVRALTIRRMALGAEHPEVAQSLSSLAGLYENQIRFGEAKPLYVEALAIFEQRLGTDHPFTKACRVSCERLMRTMSDDL